MRTNLPFVALVCLVFSAVILITPPSIAQERKRVEIKQANTMRNLKRDGMDIRRLIGDVIIVHEGVVMECDSAYEYAGVNRFDAFGNVVVTQENSRLYGDVLYYDGNTGIGRVRGEEVRLVDEEATLVTQFLNFNTQEKNGEFFNGGILYDNENRLSSIKGYYFSEDDRFLFIGDVALQSPDALLNTDTLEYFTETELANFWGPTRIYHESDYLYAERGWYNNIEGQANFTQNAYIEYEEYRLLADTAFYDREQGYAYAKSRVTIIDTINNANMYGQLATYRELNQAVDVTINALAFFISDEGDTLFMRADRFSAREFPMPTVDTTMQDSLLLHDPNDSLHPQVDSLIIDTPATNPPTDTLLVDTAPSDTTVSSVEADSTYRLVMGVGDIRFFRHDLQGLCDSLAFSTIDSTLRLFVDPIVWTEDNQLYADSIQILFKNDDIHRMYLRSNSFLGIVEDKDGYYNQMKGQNIDFVFVDGELSRIHARGSAESIYFVRDQGEIVAINRSESSEIGIKVVDNEVTTITFSAMPTSNILPIRTVQIEDIFIRGFEWHEQKRPASKHEVIPPDLDVNQYQSLYNKAKEYKSLRKEPEEELWIEVDPDMESEQKPGEELPEPTPQRSRRQLPKEPMIR